VSQEDPLLILDPMKLEIPLLAPGEGVVQQIRVKEALAQAARDAAAPFLRRREGPPHCILHLAEARARNLSDGDHVRLYNDHGSVGLVLRVSDEVQPGNVLVPGQRPDGETLSGTINMLCSDRYTDIGEGATYQSTWLNVAAWPRAT
jgi:anaerobic selenocysteine-containing dehydrogenase